MTNHDDSHLPPTGRRADLLDERKLWDKWCSGPSGCQAVAVLRDSSCVHREEETIENHQPEPPDYRATVADGVLTLAHWHPGIMQGGPTQDLFRKRARAGVTIADVTLTYDVEGCREALVSVLTTGGDREQAETTLIDWAAATGQRRIWLETRVVDLDKNPRPLGVAHVKCRSCGSRWEDGRPQFWEMIQAEGRFPPVCPLCGDALPQWSVRARRRRSKPGARRGSAEGSATRSNHPRS